MEQDINGKVQKINEEDYEIIKKLETIGYKKAVEWYKENYDCELDEAKETVKAIWEKYKVSYPGSDLDEIREMLESAKSVSGVAIGVEKGKDDIGCGKGGKIYNCEKCDVACTECYGPYDDNYPLPDISTSHPRQLPVSRRGDCYGQHT